MTVFVSLSRGQGRLGQVHYCKTMYLLCTKQPDAIKAMMTNLLKSSDQGFELSCPHASLESVVALYVYVAISKQ